MTRYRRSDLEFEQALRERLGEKKYRRLRQLLVWMVRALRELEELELPRDRRSRDPLEGLSGELRATLDSLIRRLQDAENGNGQAPAVPHVPPRPRFRVIVSDRGDGREPK